MRPRSRFFALALVAVGGVRAAEPGQPPLAIGLNTPNFNYSVRSGGQSPHLVPNVILTRAANALDRNGTPQLGNPLGYHAGYTARGFSAPYFTNDFKDVVFYACANNPDPDVFDCDNGFATLDQIIMPTEVYGAAGESCIRGIIGHELFHHVEYAYANAGGGAGCGGTFGKMACEGQARALQDKVYLDLDLNPAASCLAPFQGEVDAYLAKPDRTIWSASYSSALFWTYLMEQYGEFAFEPATGVDFLVDWWDYAQASVADPNIYRITEDAIRLDHPNESVVNAYHDYLIANFVKDTDLSGVPESFRKRYSYRDEEPVPLNNNQMTFTQVARTEGLLVPFDGEVSAAVTAKRFGGRYHVFDTGDCTAGRVLEFSATPTALLSPGPNAQFVVPDGLFALVALRGDSVPFAPVSLYKFRGKGGSQKIVQPATRHRQVVAITSGWHGDFAGTLKMRCKAPPLAPVVTLASSARPMRGSAGTIGELLVEVRESQAPFLPLGNIPADQVEVLVGLLLPAVQKVQDAAGRMRVFFPFPNLAAGSTSDVVVKVGTGTLTLSGAASGGVHAPEILIGLDLSASMAGSRIAGAARTRDLLLDLRANARVGLVTFAGASPAGGNATVQVPLAPLTAAHRTVLIAAIDAATPGTAGKVSMQDFHFAVRQEFAARGSTGERHVVVLTDSGDGDADPTAIAAAMRDAGIRVHNIALATSADQPALAQIAAETGGSFHMANDDTDSAALLLPAVQKVREAAARQQTAATAGGLTTVNEGTLRLDLPVDPSVQGTSGNVIAGNFTGTFSAIRLYRPDGTQLVPGPGVEFFQSGAHFAFHVDPSAGTPNGGVWKLDVDPSSAGGPVRVDARISVIAPKRAVRISFARHSDSAATGSQLLRDEPVLLQLAVVDFTGTSAPKGNATALVKTGTGTLEVSLNDDGVRGDERAGDGVYSDLLGRTSGSLSGYADDGTARGVVGSYAVEASIDFGTATAPNILRAGGSFAVLDDGPPADGDGDGMPNRYEVLQRCLSAGTNDAAADSDGDGAINSAEFDALTDPCDVDTDGGGETDGSELARGARAMDQRDDMLRRIEHVEIVGTRGDHEKEPLVAPLAITLRYDSDPSYTGLVVKRAPAATGPFLDHATLDAAATDGSYVDANLVAGATWCYQLVARIGTATAAAGEIVCGTVRADATAPRGSVMLNDGAPRSASALLVASFAIDGEASSGMQMSARLPDGSETGWIPYASTMTVATGAVPAGGSATIAVSYRDAAGNVSDEYVDDIMLVPSAGVGRIVGTLRAADRTRSPIPGGLALLALETEPGDTSGSDGRFALELVPPAGDHVLNASAPGYVARVIPGVVVTPGTTTDLGDIVLEPAVLFSNGFE